MSVPSSSPRPRSLLVLTAAMARDLYGDDGLAELAASTDVIGARIDPADLAASQALLADVEVLFTGWGFPGLTDDLLTATPRLKAIFFAGGTIKFWITPAIWAREIVVSSAYGANAVPVSEFTVAAIVLSLKRTWTYLATQQRQGVYSPQLPTRGGLGATVGLISLGAIGRLVRERLRALEVNVIAYDPFVTAEEAQRLGVTLVGLDELFATSDVVSLHAPLLPATEGMITGDHFEQMRPGTTFLNTARGALVREAEMAAVLARRPDLTAVLDVLWPEPPAADNPLLRLPNVMITPHIAGAMGAERLRLGRLMLEEFKRWRDGQPLHWQITPSKAELLA